MPKNATGSPAQSPGSESFPEGKRGSGLGWALLCVVSYLAGCRFCRNARILLANSRNPHSCVGGNHDKSEVPGSAGKFANSIRSFDATRGKSLGKVSNPREEALILPSHETSSHQLVMDEGI